MRTSTNFNGSGRKWKRYANYKGVSFDWLHEVPDHWAILRLKDSVRKCINGVWGDEPNGDDDDIVCIRVADFDRVSHRVANVEFTERAIPQHQRASRTLNKGDLLLEKSGGGDTQPVGAVVLFDRDIPAVCSNFIARVELNPGFEPRFLCYLHASLYACRLNIRSIKQSIGIQNLDAGSYFNEAVAFAPLDEQRSIVTFLDRETAKIDALIAKKERLIELLREKRTALISHAVTKGLDPSVPMKDSGIHWIGHVPVHWTPKKLKYLFRFAKRQNYPDLTVLSVYRDFGVIEKTTRDDNHNRTPEDLTTYQLVNVGDLVINKMKAWQGSLGISSLNGITSPDYVVYKSINDEHLPYLHHLLRIPSMAATFHCISNGIRPDQWRLEPEKFEQLWLFLPPVEEQRRICEYIDKQIAAIDALRTRICDGLEKLREYRTALISAAVTGKIDVREKVGNNEAVPVVPKPNPYFHRTVFAAEIIDQMCNDPTFGHVKFQKCLFVAQHHLQIEDFEENYFRQAAGPYDNQLVRSVDGQLERNHWFKAEKQGERYTYKRLGKCGGHKTYFDRYFGTEAEKLRKLLDLFRPLDTDRAEIVATLYAVWNDFLLQGKPINDDQMVDEVLTNWDESKTRFSRERWQKALGWMRKEGVVPSGFGKPTVIAQKRRKR